MGTSPDYLIVGNWEIDRGTMFTDKDIKSASSVVVLGQTVVDELFGMDDPIGKYIRIRNLPFRVIGTLKSKGQGMGGEDQDNIVLSPLTTVRQRLKGSRRPQMVDVAFVKVEDESKISAVQQRVTYRLRARHNLKDTQEDDFEVRDMTEIVNKVRSVGRALSILLALIASISLLVGSIGIMNMMLVSVTERTREIGTRKAIGASNKWIMFQFLVESVLISFLGSFVGLVLGIALSQIGGAVMEATVPVSLWAVALSASVAVVVGIASGGYPAYKAMKLDEKSEHPEIAKEASEAQQKAQNYPEAIRLYQQYLDGMKDKAEVTDLFMFGRLYYMAAGSLSTPAPVDSTQTEAPVVAVVDSIQLKAYLVEADTIFAQVAERVPNNYLGNFWRARTNAMLDPETTQGLAKPYYEKALAILEENPKASKNVLIECESYLGYYYFLKEEYEQSKVYWEKILAIDPENATAKQAMEGLQP